ncbi:MAG: hypothetical protein EBQ71_09955, partial [Betaproteobacteria bacterium]|nr:hypothetical protein [Betaproteobacteria bacterium]
PLVRAMADGTPRQVARAEFAWAAARPDSLPALHDFGGPLLLVSGEHDRLAPRPGSAKCFRPNRRHAGWNCPVSDILYP